MKYEGRPFTRFGECVAGIIPAELRFGHRQREQWRQQAREVAGLNAPLSYLTVLYYFLKHGYELQKVS